MDKFGNNLEQLTHENMNVQSYFVEWSPNSTTFIYFTVSIRNMAGPKTFKLWRDDGNVIQLPTSTYDEFLSWSPEGEWLIFRHYPSQTERDISSLYAIRRDGTDKHTIVPMTRYLSFHGWTPPFELNWNSTLLLTIGTLLLGGSLCVGYFNLRS